jgi:hypothetical protein
VGDPPGVAGTADDDAQESGHRRAVREGELDRRAAQDQVAGDHVRRLGRPVLNCPKGQAAVLPPDLVARAVTDPEPCWTWALVSRADETRAAVRAAVEVLTRDIGTLGLDATTVWLPTGDPFHSAARH